MKIGKKFSKKFQNRDNSVGDDEWKKWTLSQKLNYRGPMGLWNDRTNEWVSHEELQEMPHMWFGDKYLGSDSFIQTRPYPDIGNVPQEIFDRNTQGIEEFKKLKQDAIDADEDTFEFRGYQYNVE